MPYKLFSDTGFVPKDTVRKREQDRRAAQAQAALDQEYKPEDSPHTGWFGHLRAVNATQPVQPKATPPVQPKPSGGGGFLGGLREAAGNVLGGIGNTALDVVKADTPYDLIKDTVQGHPQDAITDRMATVTNLLSGRHIAENFGGGRQFARLPETAQTVADVAPSAALAAGTGGASTLPRLGVAFGKQLALQGALNYGLGKGSEAAQDVPGWGDLPGSAQQAAIMAGTLAGGHALGKVNVTGRLGQGITGLDRAVNEPIPLGERAQGSFRPRLGAVDPNGMPLTHDVIGGGQTLITDPGDHFFHGSPKEIVGQFKPGNRAGGDPLGDYGPGPYFALDDPRYADSYTQNRHPETGAYQGAPDDPIPGRNISDMTPKKPLGHLEWESPVTDDELRRVNNSLMEKGKKPVTLGQYMKDGSALWNKIKELGGTQPEDQNSFAKQVLSDAGFDGIKVLNEVTVWNPEELQSHIDYRANNPGVETTRFEDSRVTQAYGEGGGPHAMGTAPSQEPQVGKLTSGVQHEIDTAFEEGGIPELEKWATAYWSLPEEKAYAKQLIAENGGGTAKPVDNQNVPGELSPSHKKSLDAIASGANAEEYLSDWVKPTVTLPGVKEYAQSLLDKLHTPESVPPEEPMIGAEQPKLPGMADDSFGAKLKAMFDKEYAEPTPEELAKFPTVGGGAKIWRDYIPKSLKDINDALRSANTLFDVAFIARLGPQAGLDHPKLYSNAIKTALHGVVDETALRQVHNAVDAKAFASPPLPGAAMGGGTNRWLPNRAEMSQSAKPGNNGYGLKVGSGIPTGVVGNIPGIGRMVRIYDNFQQVYRPQLLQIEIENKLASGRLTPNDLLDPTVRADLGRGVNLLTGRSSLHIGNEANMLLEFPNWLAAQGELIARGLTQNNITGQMARNSLLKLVAVGAAATAAGQAAQGEGPLEHTRNGIPMLKIPGTDDTVDMFGPLGEVVSKVAGIVKGGANDGPSGAVSEGFKDFRGLASPVVKIGIDQLTKSDSIGQRVDQPMERIVNILNTAAPFTGTSVLGAYKGEESIPIAALHSLGARVHQPSPTNAALSTAGIHPDDPDFLIKRKEYIQAHPELANTNDVTDVQKSIAQKRQALDVQVRSDHTYTLQNFRDARTKILEEQRDKLGVLLGDGNRPINDTKQAGWLQSYNQLYDQAKNPRDPSGQGVDQDKLDQLIGAWTDKNGPEALDFINRYMGTGLSQAEAAYSKDLATLSKAGYWTMPQYRNMRSDLSESDINDYKRQVTAARSSQPELQKRTVAHTVLDMFGDELSAQELHDVTNSFKQAYQSKERAALQQQYRKEIQWFNPNANWESYTNASGAKKPSAQSFSRGHGVRVGAH